MKNPRRRKKTWDDFLTEKERVKTLIAPKIAINPFLITLADKLLAMRRFS